MRVLIACIVLAIACRVEAQPGPRPDITCPTGAVSLFPGDPLPLIVGAHLDGVSFCVRAGLHAPTSPIYLHTGDTLTGEYGAIIDGTNVVQEWDVPSTSILSGWNCPQGCSDVAVRNLTIRNLAAWQCIGITGAGANGWTVEHNEIAGCRYGVTANLSSGHLVADNRISGACPINGYRHTSSTWERNDISGTTEHSCKFGDDWLQGGATPDMGYITAVRIIGNRYHDLGPNVSAVWLDTLGGGNVICDNEIDGATLWPAIDVEGVLSAEVCRNRVTVGAGGVGLWIALSRAVDAHHNTFTAPAGGGALIFYDGVFPYYATADNQIRDSLFIGPMWPWFQCSAISEAACADYIAANRNTFTGNRYWADEEPEQPPPPPPVLDTMPPKVVLNVNRSGRSSNYTVITSATDNVGVVRFELRVDGALRATEPGTLPISLRAKGTHVVTAQAWDAAENVSSVARVTVTR